MSTAGANTKLPDGIEIFAAGTRTDDAGNTWTITEADLQASVAAYDPKLHEAPLTIGHPANDAPAYGWVAKAAMQPGGRLVVDTKDVEPQFAEMVAQRRFPKRSTAFYTPDHPQNPKPGVWYLRHVAFLGAQPPAVKGLRDPQFAEKEANPKGLVFFSESTINQQEHDMDKELQAKAEAAEKAAAEEKAAREKAEKEAKEAKDKLAQFAEEQRKQTHASHVAFAESMASEAQGCKILPKDKGALVATLDALATLQPVEFSEGDMKRTVTPLQFVKDLVAGGKGQVQFGEHAPGTAGGSRLTKDSSDADIDKAAKAYAAEKKVNYAEAVTAVTAHFTTAA